jgi:sulfane dehydrogenase subunit SoxC
MTGSARRPKGRQPLEPVAGNGLLDRRMLLGSSVLFAGAMGAGVTASLAGAAAEPLTDDPWSLAPGVTIPPYGQPSRFEAKVVRTLTNPNLEPRPSAARTPYHLLNGTITPNGLHFVIARGGFPDIDPDKHRLLIHGLVREPAVYTLDALHRFPMASRIAFIECGGNSAPFFSEQPIQANVQALHGLVSCAEWTGVMLSTLLEETGVDPRAKWFLAEGADAPHDEPERAAGQGHG